MCPRNIAIHCVAAFIVAIAVRQTTAVRCYECDVSEEAGSCNTPSTCSGITCSNATVSIFGRTIITRKCETSPHMNGMHGCHYITISGHRMYACMCSSDYCNGPPALPTVQPQLPRRQVTCAQCNYALNGCATPSTCTGTTCINMTLSVFGMSMVARDCQAFSRESSCVTVDISGFPTRVCTCSEDYCNTDDKTIIHNQVTSRTSSTRRNRRDVSKRSTKKATGSVGGSITLECDITSADGSLENRLIFWRRDGEKVPIFMKYSSFPLHIDPSFNGRMRHVHHGAIELRDLRPTDQDWYECSIASPHDTTKETISNRIYLSVTSEIQMP